MRVVIQNVRFFTVLVDLRIPMEAAILHAECLAQQQLDPVDSPATDAFANTCRRPSQSRT